MVENYSRTPTKSLGRKTRSRSNSKSKPIPVSSENFTPESVTKSKVHESESIQVTRRVTRRSKIFQDSNIRTTDVELECETNYNVGHNTLTKDTDILKSNTDEVFSSKRLRQAIITYIWYLSIFLLIPMIILLNKWCESGGEIKQFPRTMNFSLTTLNSLQSWKMVLTFSMWIVYLIILSHLPLGEVISYSTRKESLVKYRCNGIFSLAISVIGFAGIFYGGFIDTAYINSNYNKLIACSTFVVLLSSFFLLLKAYYCNKTNLTFQPVHLLQDFMVGTESNPTFFGLNLKFFSKFRPGFIGWIMLNLFFCLQDLEKNQYKGINLSLLICSSSQIIYCIDALIFEVEISKLLMKTNQCGFLHYFGYQVFMPFFFTLTSRNILINKFKLPMECFVSIFIINVIGYVIYRSSKKQKFNFQQNPYSVYSYHLKTLTNEHGEQLLMGGWWGILRHPDYLGNLLIVISWSLYAGVQFNVGWICPICYFFYIVIRCIRDDQQNAILHTSTWDEYVKNVPYRLIPYVF